MLRFIVRLLLAVLFLFAGTVHLRRPEFFLPIMPSAIPHPIACILISGVFELLGGMGLLIPVRSVQLLTGWGLTLLLVAVFPANIFMAVDHVKINGVLIPAWILWARLPLQPLLIVAALWVTQAWPANCVKRKNPTSSLSSKTKNESS
jgi:uncharacterized membrane protein